MIKFRSPYDDYDPMAFATPVGDEPSLTRQAFADECDVNNVIARMEKTGVITHYNQAEPRFVDVSDVGDYQQAVNTVFAAEAAFAALPSNVRSRFENDPLKMVQFLGDEFNRDEAIKLGLVNAPENILPVAPVEPVGKVSESADK